MLPATPKILRIAPERKLPVRFHAQIPVSSLRSGAILRNFVNLAGVGSTGRSGSSGA